MCFVVRGSPGASAGLKKMLSFGLLLMVWVSSAGADVLVRDAYVTATPPGAVNGALYLTLINQGETAVKLIAGQSDVSEKLEVHRHQHENGMMQMRKVDGLSIPGAESLVFQPGGYHIMLIGLKQPLRVGDQVEITLIFDRGANVLQIEENVPVRALGFKP